MCYCLFYFCSFFREDYFLSHLSSSLGDPDSIVHMFNDSGAGVDGGDGVRQFVDEEGNILEQHQDHVATITKLPDTPEKDTMSPVLTQSATFDDKEAEKISEKVPTNEKAPINDKLPSNDKVAVTENPPNLEKPDTNAKKETKSDGTSEMPPDVPSDASAVDVPAESPASNVSPTTEDPASLAVTMEKDLCKAGLCGNRTAEEDKSPGSFKLSFNIIR